MAQKFQITHINTSGNVSVLHPETNADQIVDGSINKISKKTEVSDWNAKSQEVAEARLGKTTLKEKIESIDTALEPINILTALKTVDGSGSGLDADTVDGRTVDDTKATSSNLWTGQKVANELGKKLNTTEITKIAQAEKVLRLNSEAKLEADVKGNADTATSWRKPSTITLAGDVSGNFSIAGNENGPISVTTQVKDDSHNHSYMVKGANRLEMGTNNITEFKKTGAILSAIDANGNFTGSAAKVGGYKVDNSGVGEAIWTSRKITEVIADIGAKVNTDTQTIQIGNSLKIKYGTVNIANLSSVSITFDEPFQMVLFDGNSLESVDTDQFCTKKSETLTTRGVQYTLNKTTTKGTLTWFVVGV
ncbi:MAG: hypothetical protein J6A25_04860 [Lachnospiraceae bacterium]|nr:hypothetical protein [Lachnospiraceae bacterium]MBP3905947.1 hypothetical protein [Peptostreptococcaceae bacterium]